MRGECQIELRKAGKAYPRTCAICGLFGKCAKGLDASAAPESPETEVEALGNSEPDYKAHADALAEALGVLNKASGNVLGKVEFSIQHSIRACAHQEFLAEDQDDLRAFNTARDKARAALAAYREVEG